MGMLGRALLGKWLQMPGDQPVDAGTTPSATALPSIAAQAATTQPAESGSGWGWLKTNMAQMPGAIGGAALEALQQRYPYFGHNGALNFTKNGPWRR